MVLPGIVWVGRSKQEVEIILIGDFMLFFFEEVCLKNLIPLKTGSNFQLPSKTPDPTIQG